MKKIYSIVLMATALLIGTNVNAATKVSTWEDLRTALQAGGQVELSGDINLVYDANTFKSIWIGAATVDGAAPEAAVLDMAGHNITITANSAVGVNAFVLTKGSLKITGTGTIEITGTTGSASGKVYKEGSTTETETITYSTGYPTNSTNVFFVFGADDANKVDPLTNPFSKLEIDENVTVKTKNGTVIAVDQLTVKHAALKKTDIVDKGYATSGMAYGVLVEVKGKLTSEGADYYSISSKKLTDGRKCYGIKTNGKLKLPTADDDKKYAPYVHVYPSAVIKADMRSGLSGAAAAYASGYAQWLIEGTCDGAVGAYISSGAINIKDATISSAASEYNAPGAGGHANGSGSAIVINSRSNYPGDVDVTVSGDTKASATSGYAIQEIVNTKSGDSKVDAVAIEGGTFEGGSEGALVISEKTTTEAVVTIAGGNVQGEANMGDKTLAEFLNDQGGTHATIVTDESGKTTLVISEGAEPQGDANVAGHAADARINWTGATEALSADVTLAELEINQATEQKLTVNEGVTLTVGRVVLGTKAQIIVEAGAKFIVTGEQGIVAPSVDNITLKTQEGNPAIFLFNPAVTSNRHPSATVEFISKSCIKPTKNIYQRFGIPMNGQLESIVAENNHETRFFVFDYTANKWNGIGYINPSAGYEGDPLDLSKMASPFDYYQLLDFDATDPGTIFTMKGNLVGNGEPALDILANSWKGFANSYMGKMKLSELLKLIPSTVDKAIYLYNVKSTFASWDPVTNLNLGNQMIDPMQPFLIRNRYDGAVVNLDFNEVVYKPTLGIAQSAPRRASASDLTMAKLTIENDHSSDFVIVAESNEFTPAFDNGYDASKFMNEEINLYVEADENMSIFATNSLENTMLGVSSKLGGKYTIKFSDVRGNCLILVDNMTGVQTPIVEGNSYEFEMDADVTNDGRFHIVGVRNAPTGIENAFVTEGAQAVYTILGQYVGTIDKWNTLPAGIYVVGGVKIAK